MSTYTRIILTVIIITLPASFAFAGGKYSTPTTSTADSTERVATPERSVLETTDESAVEELRNASVDDLTIAQLNALSREVDRMEKLRGKAESDGTLSDQDAERLYLQSVRSCDKIINGSPKTQRSERVRENRGGERHRPSSR